MNLKPFNLNEALNGADVITRGGHKVEQLTYFHVNEKDTPFCLVGVINGIAHMFTKEGRYSESGTNYVLDLFLAPKIITGWVNVYEEGGLCYMDSNRVWESKESALSNSIGKNSVQAKITIELP